MGQYDAQVRQQLSKYKHKDLAQRDVLNVFASFSDLKPKIDKYAFNDGSVKDLLCIDGTIPVHYKGAKYNIPVCIYVMDTHPYNPPMCFVRPTKDMLIKPSKNVDANGRIYLPYLHEWKFPNSDLIGLIQVMSVVFGEASPVYAKPQRAAPPRPTYPPGGSSHPQQSTPYPTNSAFMPMPNASGQPQNSGYYPPQNPPTSSYQPSSYPYPAPATGYPYPQSSSITPYPTNTQPQMTTAKPPPVKSQNSLSDDQVRASIQSAVEDKLKRRSKEVLQQMKSEIAVLTETQNKLKQGQETLERITNELEQQHAEVEQNTALLMRKDEEIKQVLNKMEGQQEIDIDEAVVATAPLYKQLLNLFAEENAIEDTMYYLSEALRKNVIETEVFLKHVRELSRRQYVVKALMQKARIKAGLTLL
ncbi:tumor susceptibility gene 101 protein-like isoform X2 [Antedon mediterranea]|uniref:tumor susceptibility gene 101 protein-like isoform X2 n=1 Tax=Antedon mediterranea TaxID=105859 RepID=UPI003AF46635